MKRKNLHGRDPCAGDEDPVRGQPRGGRCLCAARAVTLEARAREVILAGGAINSPQLLQLSGIGPGALLQSLGIPVVQENANVGARMQDHHGINYTWRMKVPTLNDELRPWWGKLKAGLEYHPDAQGAAVALSINQGGGFFRTHPGDDQAQHAALHAGLLDADPQGGRAADPQPRSVLRPVAGAVSNCRPDQHRRGDDQVARPAGASADLVQRLSPPIPTWRRCWRR